MFVDEDGKWPGITFFFYQAELGGGLGYGLNYVRQSGMAYDDVGKTKFTVVSAIYVTNQNLGEGSSNPQLTIGASGGIATGFTQNWSYETFGGYIQDANSHEYGIPAGAPSIEAELGIGIGISKDNFTFTLGLQAGFKWSRLSTSVVESISLTDAEADIVSDKTDVVNAKWNLGGKKNLYGGADGKTVVGWQANVLTNSTEEKDINTGITVYSGVDDKGESNNIWMSNDYKTESKKAEE